jgi:NADH-quinone oxidoreductase chain G
MSDFEITIDGQAAGVSKGETILQVAYRLGIDIPIFCWHARIDPVGACRMCLVQVEKIPKLVVACATPAAPNMVVHTRNDAVDKARRGVLEFMLVDHPLDCPTCDKGGECMLQDNVYHYGLDRSRFTETKNRFERDEKYFLDDAKIGPQIIRNMNRCIRCYRCTRFTQEVAGEGDLGVFNRGWHTEIDTLPDREIGNLFSGNTVEICPVGALMSEDFRYSARPWLSYRTPSVCNLCPDGCNLTLWNNRRELFRATSRANDAVDAGWICDRGRYAYAYQASQDRIVEPQRGDGSAWQKISWDEATVGAAGALQAVLDKHGPGAVGGLVSPTSSNESIYLFQRFFRGVLGSNSIDWRLDRKWLAEPERRRRNRAFPRITRPIASLDSTRLIVAFGCDLENERPITSLRALGAQRKSGAQIVLINNRPTRLRRKANREVLYRPGTERSFMAGLFSALCSLKQDSAIAKDLIDAARTVDLDNVARLTGVDTDTIRSLATLLAESESAVLYMGRDVRQSSDQEAIVDLALCAGELLGMNGGDRGAIELSPEYANALGATIMGAEPEVLPGAIEGQDTSHTAALAEAWNTTLSTAGGYDAAEMMEAAHNQRLKALVLLDTNPLFHSPDTGWVREALSKLDCIIALGKFDLNEAGFAHYFLPTATVHEESGTFISGEGRLQYFEAAVKPTGSARPVREVLSDLARELKHTWSFPSAQSVYAEMTRTVPQLAGSAHVSLRGSEGTLLNLDQYTQDLGSLFASASHALADLQAAHGEAPSGTFLLQTGNVGHHFGHLTHQSDPIMNFAAAPYALLHPEDCDELKVDVGHWIRLASGRGAIEVTARPSPLVSRGMVVVPIHYPEANPNLLCDRAAKADFVSISRIEGRKPDTLKPRVALAEVGIWT